MPESVPGARAHGSLLRMHVLMYDGHRWVTRSMYRAGTGRYNHQVTDTTMVYVLLARREVAC